MGGDSNPIKDPLTYILPGVMLPIDGINKGIDTIIPKPPQLPQPAAGPDSGPPPIPTAPTPTATAEQLAKRKLQALRMGLLSTITTSPGGVTQSPNLLMPAAFATGLKTQLGQ